MLYFLIVMLSVIILLTEYQLIVTCGKLKLQEQQIEDLKLDLQKTAKIVDNMMMTQHVDKISRRLIPNIHRVIEPRREQQSQPMQTASGRDIVDDAINLALQDD